MVHEGNKGLSPTTMECDDFGVALLVPSGAVRLSESRSTQFWAFF
jgi:hypothetical protein